MSSLYYALMYSLIALYVPFVESAIVFIENGQMSHFQSWIIFAVYVLMLVVMIAKFFNDP